MKNCKIGRVYTESRELDTPYKIKTLLEEYADLSISIDQYRRIQIIYEMYQLMNIL